MLLAEEFVLLSLEPDGKVARGWSNHSCAATGVKGALVADLVDGGHLDVSDGRIRSTGSRPTHPLLARALDNVVPHEGRKVKTCIAHLRHAGWREVVDGMVADGRLGRVRPGLGPTRHPVLDEQGHREVLDRVRDAAVGDQPPDWRTATLLGMAGPCQMLEVVAPDPADRPRAKQVIRSCTDQSPVASAVKQAMQEQQVAAIVPVFVAVAAGG